VNEAACAGSAPTDGVPDRLGAGTTCPLTPHAEIVPRTRPPGDPDLPAAEWTEFEGLARDGSGTTWLSVPTPHGVHVRPLLAMWTGATFIVASKASASRPERC
jgi:hypothetical protein